MPNVSVAKDSPKTVYFNPWVEPFFVKLSLDNGEVVELQGSGELFEAPVYQYKSSLVSAEIGELCTIIGYGAFSNCSGLTNVTIGNGVTTISSVAFAHCTSLTSITSLAVIAPTIEKSTFRDVKTNGTLTVPIGSTGYNNTWMGIGDWYLGKYGWTKVEQ